MDFISLAETLALQLAHSVMSPLRSQTLRWFARDLDEGLPLGGDSRDRTGDLLLARQALSQLSYIPMLSRFGTVPSKLNNERGVVLPLLQVPADQDVTDKPSAYRSSP